MNIEKSNISLDSKSVELNATKSYEEVLNLFKIQITRLLSKKYLSLNEKICCVIGKVAY